MPSEPVLISMARKFKERLLLAEQADLDAMIRTWATIERDLERDLELVARQITEAHGTGQAIPINWLIRQRQYQQLLRQLDQTMTRLQQQLEPRILASVQQRAFQGLEDTQQTLASIIVGIDPYMLPVVPAEFATGMLADGTPLTQHLAKTLYPEAVQGVTQALLKGVARGQHPRVTARAMVQGSRMALQRAMTMARTEQLRAYREASRWRYQTSGLVTHYQRLATKDRRTCIACLVRDGTLLPITEAFAAHVNCRCTLVPVVKGMQPATWQTGVDWFEAQDAATQRDIMGPGRFTMWEQGRASLEDMATTQHNSTWGDAIIPTPLYSL